MSGSTKEGVLERITLWYVVF